MSHELGALVAAAGLAMAHLVTGRLLGTDAIPRRAWLSFAGGVAVAYVFAHLLPELAEGQAAIAEGERHVYLTALLGLALFYGVEQHTIRSRDARSDRTTDGAAFALSITSFAGANLIAGYLLLRAELAEPRKLVVYALALALHFAVNDASLREHHRDRYEHVGRWVVAAAVLAGWALGVLTDLPEEVVAYALAFVGGAIVLNVIKEELPERRRARFLPFAAGAAVYAVLLQAA